MKHEMSPKSVLLFFLLPLGAYLLYELRELLVLLFFSLIFVAALNPFVSRLQRFKIPRMFAVLAVYTAFLSVLVLIFAFLIPPLFSESVKLINKLNLSQYVNLAQLTPEGLNLNMQNYNSLIAQLGGSFQSVVSLITRTFSGILAAFTFLVVTYYMLVERSHLHKHLVWLFGQTNAESRAQRFLHNLEVQLGGWVRGQLLLMMVIGSMTFVGLTLLGVPYALPLAIIAGLLEAVPNIGPTIASVPAIIIAFFSLSPTMAIAVLILYIVVQQLENNIIVPRIMASAANVSPLIAIIVIITGLKLGGVVGTLLSVPLFIFARTLINEYYGGQNPIRTLTHSSAKTTHAKDR